MENLEITGLNITSNTYLNVNELSEVVTTDIQKRVNGNNLGSLGEFHELGKLLASDPGASDYFSISVAVSDTRIVVGAHGEDTNGDSAGAAYIFDIKGNFLRKIQASDAKASAYFGSAVAVSDTKIVVSAYLDNTGSSQTGSAYLFDINGNEIAKLTASDKASSDYFGRSVAVSDTRVYVGANGEDTTYLGAGKIYIYDFVGKEISNFQANDPKEYAGLGGSMAVSGNMLVIGAAGDDTLADAAGAAYIFDLNGNQLTKLLPLYPEAGGEFGYAVDISDNTIVISSKYETIDGNANSGAVYVYDREGNFINKIPSPDGVNSYFGNNVACNNNIIVVGSHNIGNGAAYIYDINGNNLARVIGSDTATASYFGEYLDITNSTIVIGDTRENEAASSAGAAYVFNQSILPSTTSIVAGAQTSSVTYANVIDEVYKLS